MRLFTTYDVTKESDMLMPLEFSRSNRIMNVDKTFKAEITSVIRLTEMEKLFHIRILNKEDRDRFTFLPGQFVMLELPGYGEVPISISGSPSNKGYLELCIRKAGIVTSILHKARRGAKVGIRGPFGTSFPMEKMKGNNILLIAGGLGMAPLRAPLFYVTENRSEFQDVHILYGTRTPDQLLFTYQYDEWKRIDDVNLQITVEKPDITWSGNVGMITKLLDELTIKPLESYAIVCGPPIMFKFVCNRLRQFGIPMHRMFVSLERRMHCGMGKCCRCNIGSTFICVDGPVFDYWSVLNLKEAI